MLTRTIGQGRKSGNEPLRKCGLGLYGCPHLNPPLSSAGHPLTAEMDHRVPQMVETSYPGVPSLHSLRGFILTVLESSKDAVEQVYTPHHTHHLHTTTTHHYERVCLENPLETRVFGVLLDSFAVMRPRAI